MPIQLAENSVVAGRFRLNRLIGRGGMGSVWHATHLGLDIPCAVKFIEGEYSQMAEAQARFEREAKAAAQLRSPHVVQILDHGVCDGTPYIAMELLDGEDLGKRLQQVGRMHPREINTIIAQVCRALGDLLVKIIVQPMPVPSQVCDVPAGFDQWWAKASSRDPAGRFQSAKEFAESLQMVFGLSQLTDVMDRSALRAALGGTPNPAG